MFGNQYWFMENSISNIQFTEKQYMFNEPDKFEGLLMLDMWRKFKLAELTEIMHQKDDAKFIKLLNKKRIGSFNDSIDNNLKPQFTQQSDD